jgi:hypothetical protein
MHVFAALRSQNDLARARDALGSLGHAFKEAASRENEVNAPRQVYDSIRERHDHSPGRSA